MTIDGGVSRHRMGGGGVLVNTVVDGNVNVSRRGLGGGVYARSRMHSVDGVFCKPWNGWNGRRRGVFVNTVVAVDGTYVKARLGGGVSARSTMHHDGRWWRFKG